MLSDLVAAVVDTLLVILMSAGGVLATLVLWHCWRCALDRRYRHKQGDVSIEMLLVWFSVAIALAWIGCETGLLARMFR